MQFDLPIPGSSDHDARRLWAERRSQPKAEPQRCARQRTGGEREWKCSIGFNVELKINQDCSMVFAKIFFFFFSILLFFLNLNARAYRVEKEPIMRSPSSNSKLIQFLDLTMNDSKQWWFVRCCRSRRTTWRSRRTSTRNSRSSLARRSRNTRKSSKGRTITYLSYSTFDQFLKRIRPSKSCIRQILAAYITSSKCLCTKEVQ